MKATLMLASFLLAIPAAAAQEGVDPYAIKTAWVTESNQRLDLEWAPPNSTVTTYRVYVYLDGKEFTNRTVTNATSASFLLTNGRTYAFQVAAIKPDGSEGPRSSPIAGTPRLENDLAYLAAGLIITWVGLFGYAAFLARKEASIEQKLERILQTRFQGRAP